MVLLAVLVFQLHRIGQLLRHQTGMIRSASDLNLEAHEKLHEELWTANGHLAKMPKVSIFDR